MDCRRFLHRVAVGRFGSNGGPARRLRRNGGCQPRSTGAWDEAVGVAFSATGRLFVWERGGRVWIVDSANPVTTPFLDISEEVLPWRDHGMLGFALHPDFNRTGYVYVMYAVDRNHLMHCDSPVNGPPVCAPDYVAADTWQPDVAFLDAPTNSQPNPGFFKATFSRLVRYKALLPSGQTDYANARAVDPNSRRVLLGESQINQPKGGGIPLLFDSHGVGSLVFGQDGTLLASTGDNASYKSANPDSGSDGVTYYASALTDGILQEKENVGAFRAQLVDSWRARCCVWTRTQATAWRAILFLSPPNPDRPNPESGLWACATRSACLCGPEPAITWPNWVIRACCISAM